MDIGDMTERQRRVVAALDLRMGDRVLHVGLNVPPVVPRIAQLTGRPVTSVVPTAGGDPALTVGEAAGAGILIRLQEHDGYGAGPGCGCVDRILVTQGIAGVPPGWLENLAPSGVIVAPIAHAGSHPVMVACQNLRTPGELLTRVVDVGDAPHVDGRLRPSTLFHDPVLSGWNRRELEGTGVRLSAAEYESLCFFLGVRNQHISRAVADDPLFDRAHGDCVLIDPHDFGAVWLHRDGSVSATGDAVLRDRLVRLLSDWIEYGRPDARQWSCVMRMVRGTGLLLPSRWALGSRGGSRPEL